MLTADQLDALTEPIVALYDGYITSIIEDIARRLAGLDYATPMAAWQMQRLVESGAVYETALERLAGLTEQSDAVLRQLFKEAGVQALRFDDAIYRAAGLNPLPLNLSPAMADVLAAGLAKTGGNIRNLTMTTALAGQEAFTAAADLAYMQVSTGAMSYDQAIWQAVQSVAAEGISFVSYGKRRDRLDVAMRRTVLTGINQTTGKLQETRADEMGCDLVQVSAHIGARPEHQVWQGQVYSRSGTHPDYPDFVQATGYGTGPGLMGWNCRHSFYPFFEGISENAYRQAELDSFASQTVTYHGEEISVYEATQQQRAIERQIRHWKRQAGALEAAGLNADTELGKVRAWQARAREFVRQTGLSRQPVRERVYTLKTPSVDAIRRLGPNDVLEMGNLNPDIVAQWADQVRGNRTVVLTGNRRNHYIERHPDVVQHEGSLIDLILHPDEVHRNQKDPMMAIFYQSFDESHYLRASVLMQAGGSSLKHSIISFRFARSGEVNAGRARLVWEKRKPPGGAASSTYP